MNTLPSLKAGAQLAIVLAGIWYSTAAVSADPDRKGYEIANATRDCYPNGHNPMLGYDQESGKAHVYYFYHGKRKSSHEFSWNSSWSHIITRCVQGEGFFYSAANGKAALYTALDSSDNKFYDGLHKGYDIVTKAPYGYLFYDRDNGHFAFYNPDGDKLGEQLYDGKG